MKKNLIVKVISILIIISMIIPSSNFVLSKVTDSNSPIIINMDLQSFNGLAFDTSVDFSSFSQFFSPMIYEGLVTEDRNQPGNYTELLANNWSVSPNGTIYTFHLRHNIQYTDGTPFNAYTMKYSFDRAIIINDPDQLYIDDFIFGASQFNSQSYNMNVTQANNYLRNGGVSVLDEYTLQIKLNYASKYFINFLSYYPKALSPKAIIDHIPSNYTTNQSDNLWGMVSLRTEFPNLQDWTKLGLEPNHDPAISGLVPQADYRYISNDPWSQTHAVGTGPYQLINYTDNEVDFSKNTNWWGTFAPHSADIISLHLIPSQEDQKDRLISGQADVSRYLAPAQTADMLDHNGNSVVSDIVSYHKNYLGVSNFFVNMVDNLTTLAIPTTDINTSWNQSHIINNKILRYSTNETYYASLDNPFTALKFREAFAYAFDYKNFITQSFFNNEAIRSTGPIPQGMFGYQNDLIAQGIVPSQNTTLAKKLFQEVGWRGAITIYNYNSVIEDLKNTIESLNVGIQVNVTDSILSSDTIFPSGWGADFSDPYYMVYLMLDSQGIFPRYTNYHNPVIEQLINESKYETDPIRSFNLFRQIEINSSMDYPYINLFNRIYFLWLARSWISNIPESGSLLSSSFGFQFQYISKNIPSTSTTTAPTNSQNTPSFGTTAIVLAVLCIFISKKFQTKKMR